MPEQRRRNGYLPHRFWRTLFFALYIMMLRTRLIFTMTHGPIISRAFGSLTSNPRKRFTTFFVTISVIFFIVFISSGDSNKLACADDCDGCTVSQCAPVKCHLYELQKYFSMPREDKMEQSIAEMQTHLQFLDSLYRARLEDLLTLQNKVLASRCFNESHHHQPTSYSDTVTVTITPELMTSLKNLSGTKTAQGVQPKNLQLFRTPFVFQLLPHLMNDPNSLRPSYHMKSGRVFVNVVIGIPTVKRDKESYLLITLTHLVNGLAEDDINSTLIVVFVGETDLEYVVNTARQIEITFPKQVENGLIEVLSPSSSYYPDFNTLEKTLGDSMKRVKWRTKQNLDAIYLMSYAQTKGTFYLMLEDDVIAKKYYMQEIKQFTAATTIATPNWFFIEYCQVGGIGKLFRSSDLIHFVTYVQLFYNNMPIDWLLESYLADRVCSIDKNAKACSKSKSSIRPKYKTSLFQHIGLYSSLKGKIQKVKEAQFGSVPTYYPHTNPSLEYMRTDIVEQGDHTLKRAYEGQTYFWGIKPKKGDMVEFWFEKPTAIKSFTFRSSNVDHVTDKFYDTVVEVLPAGTNNYTVVGTFDEFGLADGELKKDAGPFSAIRLRVQSDSFYWVILSEIEIMTHDGHKDTR